MCKTDQVKAPETRAGEHRILFFKDQDEFVKALRDGAGEGISVTEKVLNK